MASRRGPTGAPPPAQGRQNEYFVPRDGIDREVITADICRYLGNDALVRPGNYEDPNSGQFIQGYYINAYRNLTTAMIEDLKADSARWDQERRQQSSRHTAGGTMTSRDSNGLSMRSSNSPVVQYRNSETHNSRQYYGPTAASDGAPGFSDQPRDPYNDGSSPRYPGTGSGNYNGASGFPPQQQFASGNFQAQGYPAGQFNSPSGNPGHGSAMGAPAFTQPEQPFISTGANFSSRDAVYGNEPAFPSGGNRDPRDPRGVDPRVPVTSMPSSRTTFATSGSSQDFPPSSAAPGFYPPSAPVAPSYAPVQPQDPFYGRRANTASYNQAPGYEKAPAPSRTPKAASNTQTSSSSGAPSSRHRDSRDRDSVERHADSRHGHRHRSGRN